MAAKAEKQDEIVQFHGELESLEKKDIAEILAGLSADALASIDAGKVSPYGSAVVLGHSSGKYLERELVVGSMSRKTLDRGIEIRQRTQELFRAWRQSSSISDLISP
jgi:hypothetical protein